MDTGMGLQNGASAGTVPTHDGIRLAPPKEVADLPEIRPERLLTLKEIKQTGKLALLQLILAKQDRINLIEGHMDKLGIPRLSPEDVNCPTVSYVHGHHYEEKELKPLSANRRWTLFSEMQQYEASLYGTVIRSYAATVNGHQMTLEELEEQRRFAREEDKAMGTIAMNPTTIPDYSAEDVKSMKRQDLEKAFLDALDQLREMQESNCQMALRIGMLEAKYGTSSEMARYNESDRESTKGGKATANGTGAPVASGNVDGTGASGTTNSTPASGNADGTDASGTSNGTPDSGTTGAANGTDAATATGTNAGASNGEEGAGAPSGSKRGKREGRASSGTRGSAGRNPGNNGSGAPINPKVGYGKADNSKPRRTEGCETQNVIQLPRTTVLHGEKTDDELMKLFGLTKPDELKRVKKLYSNVTTEVVRIPNVEVLVVHKFASYCLDNDWGKAATPSSIKLINGSKLSVDLAASILDGITYQHLPAERVWKEIKEWGFTIGESCMSRWTQKMSFDYLEPLYLRLQERVLEYSHIHIDETFFKVVHDGRSAHSNSYMWVVAPGEYEQDRHPIRFFIYDETRGTDVLRSFLRDYEGTVSCDGWCDYKTYKKERKKAIKLAACWVHVRRKFVKLCHLRKVFKLPKDKREKNPYYICYKMLQAIFEADKSLRDKTPEERLAGRQKDVKPLVDGFFDYLKRLVIVPKSLQEAADYALNQEESLRTFLDDPFVAMTNSEAERVAGYFALSRNAFKQIDSIDGAISLSYILTIGGTAQACGANGHIYFKYILERLPKLIEKYGMPKGGKECDLSWCDELLPWSDAYKEYEAKALAVYRASGVAFVEHMFEEQGFHVLRGQEAA